MRYLPSTVQVSPPWTAIALISVMAAACSGAASSPADPAHNASPPAHVAHHGDDTALGDSLYECHEVSGKIGASFGPDLQLADLVVWAAAFSCKNIVYDPALACASVTIVSPRKMTSAEAWDLFVASVEAAGLAVEHRGGTVAITGAARCDDDAPDPDSAVDDVDTLLADLDANMTRIDDTTFEIERGTLVRLLSTSTAARGATIVRSVKDGNPSGYRLYAVRPGSVYAKLGLRNGDTVHSVNGHALSDSADVLALYEKVESSNRLDVELTRRGQSITISYTIR